MGQLEAVLGSQARSGQQFDAWDAAYGPIDADGYPKRLWDRRTGTIDKTVAAWWRDKGYDLTDDMVQNWGKIGPSLAGKIHVYVGDMDNYYLNLAVYRMEDAAAKLDQPERELHVRVWPADEAARVAADDERRAGEDDGCVSCGARELAGRAISGLQ